MHTIRLLTATAVFAASSLAQVCSTYANAAPGININAGDDTTRNLALPFPFPFNGTSYTSIWINSNGSVSFGAGDTTFGESEALMLSGPPRVAVCWDDWYPPGAVAGGGVFFAPSPTQVNIVWKNVPRFTAGPPANMEIVLSIGGGICLFHDATMSVSTDANIVGLSAGNGAPAAPMSWTPLPLTVNSTNYQLFTNNVGTTPFNLVGSKIQLVPATANTYVALNPTPPTCAPSTLPGFATPAVSYGAGCPAAVPASGGNVYELFASGTVDLSNRSILFTAAGPDMFIAGPGPGFDNSFGPGDVRPLTDDAQVTVQVGAMGSFPFHGVQVSSIAVCSNGFLWMAPNASSTYVANATDFGTMSPRIAPLWGDWNPGVAGTVYWSTGNGYCMATWQNVLAYGTTGTQNTFQAKLFANGDIAFSYGAVLNNFTTNTGLALTGISFGQGALTAPIDMSALIATPSLINLLPVPAIVPLAHGASTTPSFGLTYTLNITSIPANSPFGAFILGFTQLNLSLGSLGMTNCSQYTGVDFVLLQVFTGPTSTFNLNVPYNLAYAGVNLFSQGVAFAPLNPRGVITSNGLQGTLGL